MPRTRLAKIVHGLEIPPKRALQNHSRHYASHKKNAGNTEELLALSVAPCNRSTLSIVLYHALMHLQCSSLSLSPLNWA